MAFFLFFCACLFYMYFDDFVLPNFNEVGTWTSWTGDDRNDLYYKIMNYEC